MSRRPLTKRSRKEARSRPTMQLNVNVDAYRAGRKVLSSSNARVLPVHKKFADFPSLFFSLYLSTSLERYIISENCLGKEQIEEKQVYTSRQSMTV